MTINLANPLANLTKKPLLKCKIVGTLGPASSDKDILKSLIENGLGIVRLNFSHGEHAIHLENIQKIRAIARENGLTVGILQDLQGPKIRCGKLINGKMEIEKGKTYELSFGIEQVDPKVIPIDYPELVKDVSIGHNVMMDDGLLLFNIIDIRGNSVFVTCEEGGLLKNRKGVNFPDSILSLPALTEKDSRDLLFGIANNVDFVAISFVQSASDVRQVKTMVRALGAEVPVIAKIEKKSAVECIDAIADEADGLMVARGDLGVEATVEKVPGFQRKIIAAANKYSKPVIVATQMLESMISNPRASLAEIADVANGVLDGADCVMLSGEMAAGQFPKESVAQMSSIIHTVENWTKKAWRSDYNKPSYAAHDAHDKAAWADHEAIAKAACEAADAIKASAIVCLTLTGSIAKSIAHWRPQSPIIAISPRSDVIQRLTLIWGVYGIVNPLFYNTDQLLQGVPKMLSDLKLVESGETIVITAGIPISRMCPTNMIKINTIP